MGWFPWASYLVFCIRPPDVGWGISMSIIRKATKQNVVSASPLAISSLQSISGDYLKYMTMTKHSLNILFSSVLNDV